MDFEGTARPAGEAVTAWLEEYFLKSEAEFAAPGHIRDGEQEICSVLGFQFTRNSWLKSASGEEPCRAWGAAWRASTGGALPPVFLQHNTHSRTVIGMVRRTNGSLNLLMLDPAKHFTSKDLDKPDWQVSYLFCKALSTYVLVQATLSLLASFGSDSSLFRQRRCFGTTGTSSCTFCRGRSQNLKFCLGPTKLLTRMFTSDKQGTSPRQHHKRFLYL